MVGWLRNFFHSSCIRRLSSVTFFVFCFLLPLKIYTLELEKDYNLRDSIERFSNLEENLKISEKPFDDAKSFLSSFIKEINSTYELNLTFEQACSLIRENAHLLPEESRTSALSAIEIFNPTLKMEGALLQIPVGTLCPILQLLQKKSKKPNHKIPLAASSSFENFDELPPSIYTGGTGIVGGALLIILGRIYPPAATLGVALCADGVRRIYNELQESLTLPHAYK